MLCLTLNYTIMNQNTNIDEQIAKRLERLKSTDKELGAECDQKTIEERFAKLKGMDPNRYTAPPITVYQQSNQFDRKTDSEKTDHLMKQFIDELRIDERRSMIKRRSSTDEDIEKRLLRLKDENSEYKPKNTVLMETECVSDDETEEEKIMHRLLSEAELPSLPGESNSITLSEDSDSLPWCTICNEDAILECQDCNRDLYCRQCFEDFHDDYELKRHKTSPFKAPKSTKYL